MACACARRTRLGARLGAGGRARIRVGVRLREAYKALEEPDRRACLGLGLGLRLALGELTLTPP